MDKLPVAVEAVGSIVLGKSHQVRLALACLLARGHLLIEDLPGMGKTTLAHALARVLGLSYQRVQFTSDLLPADILGVSVFEQRTGQFSFHQGPVFAQVLLADEINRSSPKTQSALLEAMAERQVTVEGETRPLPEPFFVIATQNPAHQSGTFPLPESQLDRFLMQIELGYPDSGDERALLEGEDPRERLREQPAVLNGDDVMALQAVVPGVHASGSLLDYLQRLVAHTRHSPDYACGLSPRGAMALLAAARAWALLAGRRHALPDDVQAVFGPVVAHRVQVALESGLTTATVVQRTLDHVRVVD